MKHYIILCNRHESMFGDNWGLFWGHKESEGGYTSDPYLAHRYREDEISNFDDKQDVPLDIELLNLPVEYTEKESNVWRLIEKGKINSIYKLGLRPKKKNVYCDCCGVELED